MKKVLLMMSLFGAGSSAFAQFIATDTYSCANDAGQTLSVEVQNQRTPLAFAKLTTSAGEKSFNGTSNQILNIFNLQSETGEAAGLLIVKPVKPGHDCGRCATSVEDLAEDTPHFAQLIYANAYYNFTCQKLK